MSNLDDTRELMSRLPPEQSDDMVRLLVRQYPCCLGTGLRPGGHGYCDCLNGAILNEREQGPGAADVLAALEGEVNTFYEEQAKEFIRRTGA